MQKFFLKKEVLWSGVIVAGIFVYLYTQVYALNQSVAQLQSDLASSTTALAKTQDEQTVKLSDEIYTIEKNLEATQGRVNIFEGSLGQISGTVGTLQKLSQTDRELLQKYSKVYFLNEHYIPESLTQIPPQLVYSSTRAEQIETRVWPHLKDLLDAATSSAQTLFIKSAYRSFAEQANLKNAYSVSYGSGANRFSADQGYSEHQLGTTVDFITTGTGGQLAGFDKTTAYQWLLANAYKYGFILSYPEGNSYYIFEPWHWRFVGVKLATDLHSQGKNFYDLEQRQIDEYLVNIFD